MRLEEMTPAHVRRALEIFVRHAWPDDQDAWPAIRIEDFADATTLEALFERFETARREKGPELRRWMLRLGNHRYPFMKFVVQEYLVHDEFFFSVDTHDHLDIRPGMPDHEAWQELKLFNRGLKAKIEDEWRAAGLPTHQELGRLAEGLAQIERAEGAEGAEGSAARRRLILVVDDDEEVALGLGALLRARGYGIEIALTGEQALERLREERLPDLVLLDYELPGFDGQEVLGRIRADPRLADQLVLMATAATIDLRKIPRVSGFLQKPYARGVLFAMIEHLLGDGDVSKADPGRARPYSG